MLRVEMDGRTEANALPAVLTPSVITHKSTGRNFEQRVRTSMQQQRMDKLAQISRGYSSDAVTQPVRT